MVYGKQGGLRDPFVTLADHRTPERACAFKSILMAKWVQSDLPAVFTLSKGQVGHVLVLSQRFLFSTPFLPVCQDNSSCFDAVHSASPKDPW